MTEQLGEFYLLTCNIHGTLFNAVIKGGVAEWAVRRKATRVVVMNAIPITEADYIVAKHAMSCEDAITQL